MIDGLLNQVNIMEKGLDASWTRNEVISNNIANADTPDFQASQVNFEEIFADALNAASKSDIVARADEMRISGRNDIGRITSAKHIDINGLDLGSLSPEIVTPDTAMRMDGNNVDPDAEMVALSKNSILYDTMTYAINKELGRIKLVARDGR